eukprot:scaffold43066_cov67-Phaeocystis_antarctica.AAC.6
MARGSRGGEPGTGGPTDHAPGPGLLQPRPGPGGRPAGSDALHLLEFITYNTPSPVSLRT